MGLILSTGAVKLTSRFTGDGFDTWGWRIPFLISIVLVGVGLYVRLRVLESPEFTAVRKEENVVKLPIVEVIKTQPREILTSALVRMSEQAPFYLFITFVLTYGTEKLKFEKGDLLNDTLVAATVGLVCVPLFGALSDIIGRRLMYGIGIVGTAIFAFP
jgi:MFS family permease